MGEVYKARDTRLQRDVAIKIVPDLATADPDRRARFQREAQLLASLNHPHIAQIYGLEESGGVSAIVMELVDGPTLADRIAAGALPIPEALRIAQQIADALDTAHEQGIIHRDLKPANLKVRDDGTVKVLDFGLAKALDPTATSGIATMNSPTMSVRATMQGMILGTAAYMSPEQAKGRPVDKRADIWAFGVVVYEMLTGRPMFSGDSTTEILGAVVLKDPDWSTLPPATPSALGDLLRRCLQKDVRLRQRDIGDVRLALNEIASGTSATDSKPSHVGAQMPPVRRSVAGVAAAAVIGGAAIGFAVGWTVLRTPPAAPPSTWTHLTVAPPTGRETGPSSLSPDGRFVVISAERLYLREFGSFETKPLPGTEGASMPFVSLDGRWIGFFANGKIRKIAVGGGDPIVVCEAHDDSPGAAWGPDNTILFSPGWDTPLSRVSADGGQPQPLTTADPAQQERGHWWPEVLPDGRHAVFTIWRAASGINESRVGVLDLSTGKHTVLFPGADAHYLRPGRLLYFHAGAWHVIGFDPSTQRASGAPVTVLADAMALAPQGGVGARVSIAADTIAYRAGPFSPPRELVWIDRAGRVESTGLPPRPMDRAALSADGRRVAASRSDGGTLALWVSDLVRKTEERLALPGGTTDAVWSRAGDQLAFTAIRKGDYDTYVVHSDGSGERAVLLDDFDQAPFAWDRDGRRLIVVEWHHDGSKPIVSVDVQQPRQREVLVSGDIGGDRPTLSFDDRWLAYLGSKAGPPQVYVQPFPGTGPAVRVSTRWAAEPVWSPVGKELFYRRGDDLISVSYGSANGRFEFGEEKILFTQPSFELIGASPDGQRFLIARRVEPEPPPGVRVILNWSAELDRAESRR